MQYKQDSLFELSQSCKEDPKILEDISSKLTTFSNLDPLTSHRCNARYIKGLFHKNGLVLTGVNVDNHFNGTPEEIDPITLKDLWNSLNHYQQANMNVVAHTGLRPEQLGQTRLDQIKPITETYSIIDYSKGTDKFQVKTRIPHYAFIPSRVLAPTIHYAKERGTNWLFEDHEKTWRDMTEFARAKYKVHITAKYFRQRFKTIAEPETLSLTSSIGLRGQHQATEPMPSTTPRTTSHDS